MTTAQECWDAYRDAVGGVNHDGSFQLPEKVSDLGAQQHAGWMRVANLFNEKVNEEKMEMRKSNVCLAYGKTCLRGDRP